MPATRETLTIRPDSRGLWCGRGGFHIDPWRPVETAVLTHAHADHARSGSARYLATPESLPILRARLGEDAPLEALPYGEVVRLGDVEVSLHPAGHILGSAQVRVREPGGATWVVTGDFKRAPDPTCAPFEVVPCDVLVTEATFALPVYRWPRGEVVAGEILDWWRRNAEAGRTSVLLCYALGKAQRILSELHRIAPDAGQVYLHGATTRLTEIYRAAGIPMLETVPVAEVEKDHDFSGDLVLAPPSAAGTTWVRRFAPFALAFASGWMRVRGDRRRRNVETGFVLSDHADWQDLVRTAVDCGARRVLATHGQSDVLCRFLREVHGLDATALETSYEGEDGADAGEQDDSGRRGGHGEPG